MVISRLRHQQLPLGPLAGPLPYFVAGAGKLHVNRNCPAARPVRARLVRALFAAGEVTHARLCTVCRNRLPQPAQDHLLWCRAAERAQRALCAAADPADDSDQAGSAADRADLPPGTEVAPGPRLRTWRLVAGLDKAALGLQGADAPARRPAEGEITHVLARLSGQVAASRTRVAAELAGEPWLRFDEPAQLLALTTYRPQRRLDQVTVADELLARARVVAALPSPYAFAVVPAGLEPRLDGVLLGPAEDGDDEVTLLSALRLLADRTSSPELGDFRVAVLQARMVHQVASCAPPG